MAHVAVIGSGSYGTCLAMLWGARHQVKLWCRSPELARRIDETRKNEDYLPTGTLPPAVRVTSELTEAVSGCDIVVGVTPSHAIREVFCQVAPALDPEVVVVNASKGLEQGTLDRIDQIYAEILPPPIAHRAAYLSGPTFAHEVAMGMPGALVIASKDTAAAAYAQAELVTDTLRIYTSPDVVGVLIGGALKNVVAIAAGISDGLGFGHNARAALITRGLAEIARIGTRLGADPLTFAGLSGMGDLVLTCSGDLSRNRRVGLALGRGQRLDDIIAEMRMVAEGVKTTRVAYELSRRLDVSAPISEFMYQVMYEDRPVQQAIADLMQRSLKSERD